MTETGAPVTRTVPADWSGQCLADDIYASAGRPSHLAAVEVVAPDGTVLPVGETGELVVESDTLFVGYDGSPELTAEAVHNGWLRTGDIGHLDAAGYVYVTDRAKDMVVSGGMNVFPAEVEAAFTDMPGLVEIAAFGVPHDRWGETVVVAAVVRPEAGLDAASVLAWTRDRLAGYKRPTTVHLVEALPRNASMKVQKHILREQLYGPDAPDEARS